MSEHYRRVIAQICEVAGVPCPPAAPFHFEMGGAVVALVHDTDLAPHTLYLLCDLGSWSYPDLHAHLLRQNCLFEPEMEGFFAVHPESANVVYRTKLALTAETSGEDLIRQAAWFIEAGRTRLAGSTPEHWVVS